MNRILGAVFLVGIAHCQSYGSSSGGGSGSYGSSSGSYGSPSSSMNGGGMGTGSQSAVNLPLLHLPSHVGSASWTVGGAVSGTGANGYGSSGVGGGTGGGGGVQATTINYLASLPSKAIEPLYTGPQYIYGTYGTYENDVDPQRQQFYNHTMNNPDYYLSNYYTMNREGYKPINLSDPNEIAMLQYWAPHPYQLTAWDDVGVTTQAPTVATTAAPTTTTQSTMMNSGNIFYGAYPGNIANIGYAGLGMPVYGPAPMSNIYPGLNTYFQTGSGGGGSGSGTGGGTGTGSYGGSTGGGSSYGGSTGGGSTGGGSSMYGRRRRRR